MIDKIIAVLLRIDQIRYRHPDDLVLSLQHDIHPSPPRREINGALQLVRKIVIVHRLYHKVYGIDLITSYGILRHVRDKYDPRRLIRPAHLVRRLKPVHAGHLDIKKNDIKIRPEPFQKLQAPREEFRPDLRSCLLLVTLQELIKSFSVFSIIVYDRCPHVTTHP